MNGIGPAESAGIETDQRSDGPPVLSLRRPAYISPQHFAAIAEVINSGMLTEEINLLVDDPDLNV